MIISACISFKPLKVLHSSGDKEVITNWPGKRIYSLCTKDLNHRIVIDYF